MVDFISLVEDVLKEQNKSKQYLFENNVISKHTFFKYKQRTPSLKTAIAIANFLKVSLDYLFELTTENKFEFYDMSKLNFSKNLTTLLDSKNISARQLCKELKYSRANVFRWKKGITPSIQTLLEISNYFNCTIDDILK